jgi:hypothetical protein
LREALLERVGEGLLMGDALILDVILRVAGLRWAASWELSAILGVVSLLD